MSKKEFFELVEKHGMNADYTPGFDGKKGMTNIPFPFHIMLDAPEGKLFKSTDIHCDGSIQGEEGTIKTNWKFCVKALKEIIAQGFEDCIDPDCDICNPDEE